MAPAPFDPHLKYLSCSNILTHLGTGYFVHWKKHFQKDSLQSCWKGPYQGLLTKTCAVSLLSFFKCISHDTPKERTDPDLTCISSGDLKVNIF